MLITSLIFFLPYLVPALLILVAVILVRKYFRTRDIGLLWLAIAVVVWPLVSRLVEHHAFAHFGSAVQGHSVGFYQFLVVKGQVSPGTLLLAFTLAQQFIGAVFLLLAVLYLYRARRNATQ